MTTAQVVEMSVTYNSLSKDYSTLTWMITQDKQLTFLSSNIYHNITC